MTREIKTIQYQVQGPWQVGDPVAELQARARAGSFQYLLAHADDGVIWGEPRDGQLALSSDAFPEVSPPLRAATLQQARLFGKQGEAMVWRAEAGWLGRAVIDGAGEDGQAYDEAAWLWGTNAGKQDERGGFWLAEEADLGVRHAPPKPLSARHSLRLLMRHYLKYDEAGAVYVAVSRLVDVLDGGER